MERVSVADAAARLGVTPDAVRQRIRRGTMEYEKDADGRYYVYLTPQDGRRDGVHNPLADALVESLQDQIAHLKSEVEVWREESRRKDLLLAAALERIPSIEASPEPSESPVTPADQSEGVSEGDGQERPSWWRRFFFGDGGGST